MISATGRRHQGSADGGADDGLLGDRSVPHPLAEAVAQALGGLERAAGGADILAEEDDMRVGGHLVGDGPGDGLAVVELD
jgi:hypothetical protein